MKLFGFNIKLKTNKFFISEADREWVEENFKWLVNVYGYPSKQNKQILFSGHFFPKTFNFPKIETEDLIDDLSVLFNLERQKITFEMHEDLASVYGIPYQTEGMAFEIETEVSDKGYKIHIAKSLKEHHKRLAYSVVYEFIKIKLLESNVEFDTGEDTSLFVYIAGIYFGFGIILSQNLTEIGRSDDGFWETKWVYISEIPKEIMAFGLATYSKLIEEKDPEWKEELPKDMKLLFIKAIAYLNEFPGNAFAMLKVNDLFNQADKQYKNLDYDLAISTLQEILSITKDGGMMVAVYNNIGYYQIRKGDFEKSIENFKYGLKINPNHGYCNDNLGYALIKVGQLDEGKKYLENALLSKDNDVAYTNRNLALYHFAKGELKKAEEYFQLAFATITQQVDLLELHYSEFLFKQGKKDEALKYLKIAIEKGEPEAIKKSE